MHVHLPQSELGGLHPELRAAITAAKAVTIDFAVAQTHPFVDYTYWAWRLNQHIKQLLAAIERETS